MLVSRTFSPQPPRHNAMMTPRRAAGDEAGVIERIDRALACTAEVNAQYSEEKVDADLSQATQTVQSRKRKA